MLTKFGPHLLPVTLINLKASKSLPYAWLQETGLETIRIYSSSLIYQLFKEEDMNRDFNFFSKLLIIYAIFLLVLSRFVYLILTILVFLMPIYYINLSPTLIILIIHLFLTQFLTGTPFPLKSLLPYPFPPLNHC